MPEPVILEEHIVEKVAVPPPVTTAPQIPSPPKPPAEIPDVGLVIPKRPLSASAPLMPKLGLIPPEMAPQKVLPSPLSLDATPVEIPSTKPAPPPEAAPAIPVPLQVQQPKLIIPATPAASAETSKDISTDIQKILSQVKLPERRDFKGTGDTKSAGAPVSAQKDFGQMVTKPPTSIEEANSFSSANSEAKPVSSVHTLKDDLQDAVREKKMSLVRAVSLEQDKKRTELIEEDFGRKERRKRVSAILFATFLLFGLGFAALFGVYLVMMSHSATDAQQLNSIVFAEQSVALPMQNSTGIELKRRVAGERQVQTGSLGSITRVVPVVEQTGADGKPQPRQATTQEFFRDMDFNAPDSLVQALSSEFFFGLHVVDKNAPVLVIPVKNYDRAFAGMLAWEGTMNADLSPAFTPLPSTVLDVHGVPSSRIFQDDVMRNYDVREMKDDGGQVQLYYSFPSPNMLIIAESPYSFPELLSRLQSVRKL